MKYYVYILTNVTDKVMYVGVTNNLLRRLYEHKNELVDGFSKFYHTHKLVHYEEYNDVMTAIEREKQIKGWTRAKKNQLVLEFNPNWKDISEDIFPGVF